MLKVIPVAQIAKVKIEIAIPILSYAAFFDLG